MKNIIIFFLLALTFVSCKKEAEEPEDVLAWCELIPIDHVACGPEVIIDVMRFDSISNTYIGISNIDVTDDCLSFDLSASGCDGESWDVKVINDSTISYSNPISKKLKVEFINSELCLAFFTKQYSFDLYCLRENTDSIINLNILDLDTSVLYSY